MRVEPAKAITVPMSEVSEGDFLIDLDNGYVVDVELGEFQWVTVTFHDANGAECTLSVPDDHPIRIVHGGIL